MSFLAPQAYTKETLSKAFDWLQYQPEEIKQVATSPDTLVSLFLKAQRQGLDHIDADAPISSKKFISDLKSLKKDIAQFEEPPQHASHQPTMHQPVYQPPQPSQLQPQHQPQMPQQMHEAAMSSYQVSQTTTVSEVKSVSSSQAAFLSQALDTQSLQAIQVVQERFNLSSQQEALRMLIAVGAKQIGQWP